MSFCSPLNVKIGGPIWPSPPPPFDKEPAEMTGGNNEGLEDSFSLSFSKHTLIELFLAPYPKSDYAEKNPANSSTVEKI